MTERERQILLWITQNPMISQNELAELAGITRSSVAVHISNLIKKGYLRGRGYIVAPPSYVAVIGAVNMDVFGVASHRIVGGSSNEGHVFYKLGGVGRNIALNLCRLDVPNYLVTVYGDDYNGELFKSDAVRNGMDITYSRQLTGVGTSTYLYVNQPDGDRMVGLDDMGINGNITPDFLEERRSVVDNADRVVIDSNLSQQAIDWVYDNCDRPVFAKSVSVNKARRLLSRPERLDTLVLDFVEAEVLSGVKVTDEASARRCADVLIRRGVRNVCVHGSNKGMLYRNADESVYFPLSGKASSDRNTNGAGASAVAALTWARGLGCGFGESGRLAVAAASLTAESNEAVNPGMSADLLRERAERFRS